MPDPETLSLENEHPIVAHIRQGVSEQAAINDTLLSLSEIEKEQIRSLGAEVIEKALGFYEDMGKKLPNRGLQKLLIDGWLKGDSSSIDPNFPEDFVSRFGNIAMLKVTAELVKDEKVSKWNAEAQRYLGQRIQVTRPSQYDEIEGEASRSLELINNARYLDIGGGPSSKDLFISSGGSLSGVVKDLSLHAHGSIDLEDCYLNGFIDFETGLATSSVRNKLRVAGIIDFKALPLEGAYSHIMSRIMIADATSA
jgi:hypothetical protein